MADKFVFVREIEGILTAIEYQVLLTRNCKEICFEAARIGRAMQKMWKIIGDNPTFYCSM